MVLPEMLHWSSPRGAECHFIPSLLATTWQRGALELGWGLEISFDEEKEGRGGD